MSILLSMSVRCRRFIVVSLLLSLPATVWSQARHQATLHLKNRGQAQGEVRYMAASRSFEITVGSATRTISARDVERIVLVQQPQQLNQALNAVRTGNYQAAIPVLAKIVEDYTMFGPDLVAGQALAQAYLRTNRAADALKMCEQILRMNEGAVKSGPFASVYWEALLENNREATLRISLREAVETGIREVAAVALVRRGDLEAKAGNHRDALLDGYLRAILMFQDIRMVQPEALYKAIKAHEALNEVQFAERWRRRLLASYATSEFATKLK